MRLADIATLIQGELYGDADLKIQNLASLNNSKNYDIIYLNSINALEQTKNTQQNSKFGAIITTKQLQELGNFKNAIIVTSPSVAAAKLSQVFAQTTNTISKTAIIAPSAKIGNNCQISANCFVGENVIIGENVYIYPNVCIMDNTQIGDNTMILSGAIIGSQGFGNAFDSDKKWHRIHHFGKVMIGKNVVIGANTTIDNATFDATIIEDGVRIDNLVHIAHNVKIGENTAIAAKTGIAGSTIIGKNCQIGGMVGIVGHLNICDNVVIYATTTVNKSIKKSGFYTGFLPIMEHKKWKKIAFLLTKFDKIVKFLKIKVTKL